MAGDILNYPPQIEEAVTAMNTARQQLDDEMTQLKSLVERLVANGNSAALTAFNDVQAMWQSSGLSHNETLTGVAKAAGDSYTDIVAYDASVARQLQ